MKRRKGELKHARSKRKNKGRKKKKKKKDHVNNKKKQGGQHGKVNACAPVICSREEPPGAPRDLWSLRKAEESRLVGSGRPPPADSGNLAAGTLDFMRIRTLD